MPSPSASILPFAGNIARSEHVIIYYLLSISFLILVPSSSASILPFVGNIARSEHVITYYLLFIIYHASLSSCYPLALGQRPGHTLILRGPCRSPGSATVGGVPYVGLMPVGRPDRLRVTVNKNNQAGRTPTILLFRRSQCPGRRGARAGSRLQGFPAEGVP